MRTVGVDLSVAEKGTAAATVEWEGGRARVREPSLGHHDEALIDLLAEAEWSAIDAPFGWPEPMVSAVHAYASEDCWPAPDKRSFRLRRTDLHVHDRVLAQTGEKLWPLSPSTDRISLTAWRLAGLREAAFARSQLRFDRAGGDQVVEAYPAAALLLWGLPRAGYKSDPEAREQSCSPRLNPRPPGWPGSPAPRLQRRVRRCPRRGALRPDRRPARLTAHRLPSEHLHSAL